MKENSIEEDIINAQRFINSIKTDKEYKEENGWHGYYNKEIVELARMLEHILSDYKRVLKENEELLEVKVSTSAHNRILELEKENEELKKFHIQDNKHLDFIMQHCIPVQKVEDIIDRIDYDIKKTKEIISNNSNIYTSDRRNDYQIVRLRAMNTKSLDIKKRLQELLEGRK